MHHSRTYPLNPNYSNVQDPSHEDGPQFPTTGPPYHRGFGQQQGSGHYYVQGEADDAVQPNPYYRSMTPMIAQSHRYTSSGGDPRYYEPAGGGGSSSSHMSQYSPQSAYHPLQYPTTEPHRSHHSGKHSNSIEPGPQFIPTPSEIANVYTNYSPRQIPMSPRSPTHPSDIPFANPQYPTQHVSSSRSPSQRLTRISTSRPRTAPTSAPPISGASPSGERFPCEKCGKTFSRSHDRKRHHETQHMVSPVIHRCRYCEKEFSRADSLKRHLDNGCEEMP